MGVIVKRNIKLYFRDKINLLLSLMAIFIIIALYILFLGNVWGDYRTRALPESDVLRHSWLTAGKLTVATITTSMGAFGVIVNDRVRKINKGFYASPLKRGHITSGYILSAFIVGVIMTIVTFVPLAVYTVVLGGALTLATVLQVVGLILLCGLSGTAMVCFITSFMKTYSAFGTTNTIIGTLIGFMLGIYLPIGTLPESVQTVIKLFPPSHGALLMRRVLMASPIERSFEDVPAQYVDGFKEMMGVVYRFGSFEVGPAVSVVVLLVSALVFYGLALVNMRRN